MILLDEAIEENSGNPTKGASGGISDFESRLCRKFPNESLQDFFWKEYLKEYLEKFF